jgi:hypothetical protein
MIDEEAQIKLLKASTKGFDGKNHLQSRMVLFHRILRHGFTSHGALQIMIVHHEKAKQFDASTKEFEESNRLQAYSSFPFDLGDGNTLHWHYR